MITKEQFDKSYIVNDYGVLRDKYLKLASSFDYTIAESGYEDEVLFKGSFKIIQQWSTLVSFKYSHFNKYVNRNELTLEDFNEEGEEMDTKDIDWSQAPEGYDYWIEYVGELSERPLPDFHKLTTRVSGAEVYSDSAGEFYLVNDRNIVVYKRPEPIIEDKKIIQKYTREEFNTRGQALDSYDSGVVFYTPSNDGYSVVDESGILDHFGQLFTLEEREETWQDVAQEFIKSNPVFDEDEFLLEMFSDDYSEYHAPMRQLAKLIVENSGD